jgi:hypothetical protein
MLLSYCTFSVLLATVSVLVIVYLKVGIFICDMFFNVYGVSIGLREVRMKRDAIRFFFADFS